MGVIIPMKRERMLTIRVTDDEHARLLERCEGKQLAVWMRRVCLGEPVARSGKLPTLAQPLLRQLAAIGNNLNQTARKVNSGQWSSGDRVQVVAALMAIGDELRRLRLAVREQGARDENPDILTHRCHAICEEIHVRCSVVRGEGAAAWRA